MTKVYFSCDWSNDHKFVQNITKQTPGSEKNWGDIKAVGDINEADYHIAFNDPSNKLDPEKLILFCMEPPANTRCDGWDQTRAINKLPLSTQYKPQRWWINKNYDELQSLKPIDKEKDLSWITTDKGLIRNHIVRLFRKIILKTGWKKYESKKVIPNISLRNMSFEMDTLPGGYDGHILRMNFLDRLVNEFPNILDLYGRGNFPYTSYKGEIDDKWVGLENYRYTLAIENYKGPNYFSEKLTDALLSWCMPIYWGCTNLGEFLPEDSFVWIDIEDEDAPGRIREIINSDLREQNLDAIAEARQLLLNKYQIWPTVERTIDRIEK